MTQTTPSTIKVIATNGGFRTFVAFISAMFIFLIVFLVGIVAGVSAMVASGDDGGIVQTSFTHKADPSTVAVLDISGVIDGSNASFTKQAVQEIVENKNIKAVVLRVNSPGGGVTTSDEIWHYLQKNQGAKDTAHRKLRWCCCFRWILHLMQCWTILLRKKLQLLVQ